MKYNAMQCSAENTKKVCLGLEIEDFFHFFYFGLEKCHHQIHLKRILYNIIELLSIAKHFIAMLCTEK